MKSYHKIACIIYVLIALGILIFEVTECLSFCYPIPFSFVFTPFIVLFKNGIQALFTHLANPNFERLQLNFTILSIGFSLYIAYVHNKLSKENILILREQTLVIFSLINIVISLLFLTLMYLTYNTMAAFLPLFGLYTLFISISFTFTIALSIHKRFSSKKYGASLVIMGSIWFFLYIYYFTGIITGFF